MKTRFDTAAHRRAASNPKTLWGFLSVVVICATAVFAIDKLVPNRKAPPRRLWTPLLINNQNAELIAPDTLRLEFWTPSAKTKDYLSKEKPTGTDTNRSWEMIDSEERVVEFGKRLRDDVQVLGFRRSEVWGHGRTGLKPGWWWSVTVSTNYTSTKLVKAYRDFWKTSGSVFVEVIDNRGHDEP